MRLIFALLFILINIISFSQDSFYKYIDLGKYQVGFCDSIIYCEQQKYSELDYEGPAPLFIQIWHPIEKSNSKPLTYQDFRNRKVPSSLSKVYQLLGKKMDSSFVWYNITEDIIEYDSINYGKYSYFEVLDSLKKISTKSFYEKINPNNNFPVIVYHHGSQGLSDENFILAEYFASRGYIVISSNFHLPYKSKTYGMPSGDKNEAIDLTKIVIDFSRTLTKNKKLFYIGHSWGAQTGFTFLYEKNQADAFISLETTLEFWDSTKIASTWPSLNMIMNEHAKDYSLPILLIANTQKDQPFSFFKGITNTSTIHVSAKEEFAHESYTSGFMLRYLYNEKLPQPDSLELKIQLNLYHEHLRLMDAFLNSVQEKKKLDGSVFEKDFYINYLYKN